MASVAALSQMYRSISRLMSTSTTSRPDVTNSWNVISRTLFCASCVTQQANSPCNEHSLCNVHITMSPKKYQQQMIHTRVNSMVRQYQKKKHSLSCIPECIRGKLLIIKHYTMHSALTLLVGRQEGHPACKNWVVVSLRGYLSEARCRFAYGPADATATHCLLLQGSPGQNLESHKMIVVYKGTVYLTLLYLCGYCLNI